MYENGQLKGRVHAALVEGEAHEAVRRVIGKILGVPKSSVVILNGQESRHKKILIKGGDKQKVIQTVVSTEKR